MRRVVAGRQPSDDAGSARGRREKDLCRLLRRRSNGGQSVTSATRQCETEENMGPYRKFQLTQLLTLAPTDL